MGNFMEALVREDNNKLTENGAVAFKSTLNDCLDLFGKIGSLRSINADSKYSAFLKAYKEDALTAVRTLFYGRDIRGGLGERNMFREIYRQFAFDYPKEAGKNVKFIPLFGRWDDLYCLVGTPIEDKVIEVIKAEHEANHLNSLMYKWLKSVNSSSKETNRLGRWTAKTVFKDTEDNHYYKHYRTLLRNGRENVRVVEQKMSKNAWSAIDYNFLTSYNMIKYLKAFYRHDEDRFLEKFFTVLKADTLFPYDIVNKVLKNNDYRDTDRTMARMYAKFWDKLPDYTKDNKMSTLVVADTSGSMDSPGLMGEGSSLTPMDVSLSLAIYFAERLKGEFHDTFMTFSNRPTLQKLVGDNLYTKLSNLDYSGWDMNTNIEAVFDKVLLTGKNGRVSDEDMPKRILIISDMEFDACATRGHGRKMSFIDTMKAKYSDAGYTFPQLVFWNVGRAATFHMTKDDNNFIIVSGNSPRAFQSILNGEQVVEEVITKVETVIEKGVTRTVTTQQVVQTVKIDPMQAMLNTVHGERYQVIQL